MRTTNGRSPGPRSASSVGVLRAHGLTALLLLAACGSNSEPPASNTPAGSSGTGGAVSSGSGSGSSSSTSGAGSGSGSGTPASTGQAGGSGSTAGPTTGSGDASVTTPSDGGATATGDSSVACNPADKKADPTPVDYKMIVGYQSLTKVPTTGPAEPVIETDPGLPKWTVYRPKDLGGGDMLHAILVWANGGCLEDGTLYGQWLLQAASYGFVALADGIPTDPSADPGTNGIRSGGADGKPQEATIDWIVAENERPCSQYYHKLNVNKIAVSGQSCGGLMSLAAAGDKRVTTAIINNSGLFSPDMSIYSALHAPIAYFIGGSSDIAYSNSEQDYMNINNVPIFDANDPVGHGATWTDVNAGEFGRVNLGWLQWQLNGDMTAAKMFVGADCELCKSTTWTVKKKMLN